MEGQQPQQERVLLIAVDDSQDSQRAFAWAVSNLCRPADVVHIVHVVPRLAFAAQYGALRCVAMCVVCTPRLCTLCHGSAAPRQATA
jgi:hypothetical protein